MHFGTFQLTTEAIEQPRVRLLNEDLNAQGIVTKCRVTRNANQTAGRRFTYGPLAYLLKNRTYLGEFGNKGERFAGEHGAIIDQATFDQVQDLMKANSVTRRQKRSNDDVLLTGLLYDDRGNRKTPSFSTKRGVRYRFYVSSALLSGRKDEAGSVTRVTAPDLESKIVSALRERFAHSADLNDQELIDTQVERIVIGQTNILMTFKTGDASGNLIELARSQLPASPRARIEIDNCPSTGEPDISLIHALARAHLWLKALSDGTYQSIDELANVAKWNSKVIRKVLRLAFLAPDITEAIFLGSQPKSLNVSALQAISACSWDEQRRLLEINVAA